MSDSNMKKQASIDNSKNQTGMDGNVPSPELSSLTGGVFISYKHCNRDLVDPVLTEFKKRGISYFDDSAGIGYGVDYGQLIAKAVSSCSLMLLFWTPEVKESEDIIREVALAKSHKKPFVIYKVGDFKCDDQRKLHNQIAEYSRYEVQQQTPETIMELVNWIQRLLGSSLQIIREATLTAPAPIRDSAGSVQAIGAAGSAKTHGFFPLLRSSLLNLFWKKPVLQQESITNGHSVAAQYKSTESVSGDVFISYRSHNLSLVEPILKELRKRGITYYIDREKLKSGNYSKKIAVAINSCKILFLFWTEDVDDSKYIPNELNLAFDWGKVIIPYKVGNFDIDKQFNVILFLKGWHILDESQDSIIDVVDSIEQALKDLS